MATSPSGVVHVPGTFGQAGLFNAAGLLTYSGSPPLGSFGTASFTITFWMRDDYAGGNAARRYILGNRGTTIASPGPYITASTGGIPTSLFFAFSMKDAAGNAVDVVWNDPTNRIKSGKWTHIALRRQVGIAEIFVDGNIAMAGETASKLAVDLGPTAANFTIGRIPQADPPMTGGIDGLRIYRGVALTPTQIAALAAPIPRP